MSSTDEAISALESVGLTEYEARCFVALTRISRGTAKEVSQVADVPRSRVYDIVERLERRGIVDVQLSDPREYKAVPVEMAIRRLREDYDSRVTAAENALQQVEEPESTADEGMWSITQTEHVTDRIVTFLEEADESVHYLVAAEEVLEPRIHATLQDASDRGVDVIVEVPTDPLRERFEEAVPDAAVIVESSLETTAQVYSEQPGQLLMVDGQSIVTAGIQESELPDVTHQTAVWTYGHDHGMAAWVRELLDDRLSSRDADR